MKTLFIKISVNELEHIPNIPISLTIIDDYESVFLDYILHFKLNSINTIT